MNLEIKSWGNSAGLRLTKNFLNELSVDIGDSLDVEIKCGVVILKPSVPVYTLDELIDGSSKESLELNDEDRAWLNAAPVGNEFK